jgi:sterol desaturase/sphingolipid hydroxylase (fatty acid hydroxylase superfamily)
MTVLSGYRNLTLDYLASYLIILPVKALTGVVLLQFYSAKLSLPIFLYIVYQVMSTFYAQLAHSSLKVVYPQFLSLFFLSPALHWFHHSANPKHFDSNFGPCLAFWDRIFGTYIGEDRLHEISSFGVEGTQYNKYHPFIAATVLPIRKFILNI